MLALAACSGSGPQPSPSVAPSESEGATASPSATVDPDSAEGRLAAFEEALESAWSEDQPVDRQRTIDALIDAGFDSDQLEVTDEIDAVGGRVANIEVAARIDDQCIIGQSGQDGTRALVAPALQSGGCLVGDTPPVD